MAKIKVENTEIAMLSIEEKDYISLTDMANAKKCESRANAIGITVRKGKYWGTYAHKDIAFEFGSAISISFEMYLITEFQRLKEEEQELLGWSAKRELAKINDLTDIEAITVRDRIANAYFGLCFPPQNAKLTTQYPPYYAARYSLDTRRILPRYPLYTCMTTLLLCRKLHFTRSPLLTPMNTINEILLAYAGYAVTAGTILLSICQLPVDESRLEEKIIIVE